MGMTERADAQNQVVAKADEDIHKPVQETAVLDRATQTHKDSHGTDWVTAQQEDPILKIMIEWISDRKVQDLKHLLGDDTKTEEGKHSPKEPSTIVTHQMESWK